MESPFLSEISAARSVLLAGAGGGFDLFSGIPLFCYLRNRGQTVHLGSLSFSSLDQKGPDGRRPTYLKVGPETPGNEDYFPERYLSEWYKGQGLDVPVYCFHGAGARTLLGVYEELKRLLDFDVVVLVDGGTDSLMRGDEPGLGSPAEDLASIAAVDMLEGVEAYLVNLGFGVDAFHGVCHAYVLEAVADLTRTGDFLGAFSVLKGMPEFEEFEAVLQHVHSRMPGRESIVASSILAAGLGRFGDVHLTVRTEDQELFINPLMSLYWCFRLQGVARRCLYLDWIRDTYSRWDVHRSLTNYLSTVKPRPWRTIPH